MIGILINDVGAVSRHSGRGEGVPYRAMYRPVSTFFDWSKAPFLCGISPERFCPYVDNDQIAREFYSVDLNNDLSIDRDEYEAREFRGFRFADTNQDSLISLAEWHEIYGRKKG